MEFDMPQKTSELKVNVKFQINVKSEETSQE
jgi:hypothetical protein